MMRDSDAEGSNAATATRVLLILPSAAEPIQATTLREDLENRNVLVDVTGPAGSGSAVPLDHVDPHSYAGLVIMGAPGTDALVHDAAVLALIRVIAASGKPVLALGRGSRVLEAAHPSPAPNLLVGRSHGQTRAFLKRLAKASASFAVPETA